MVMDSRAAELYLSWGFLEDKNRSRKGDFALPVKEIEFLRSLVTRASIVTCLKAKCHR